MNTIIFEKEQHIAKIIFNRPESFNSFNREMALTLQDVLDDCANDQNIRALYITGNGKAFCAGQDLKEVTDPNLNVGFEKILDEHFTPIILKLRNIQKPVLAAVNGVAAGAGANIALACDIVVASSSASFVQAFSKIGLVPDCGGSYFLPRLVGFQKALGLAMLGDKLEAKEAEHIGLIYKMMPAENFAENSWALATTLANMPTRALALIKELFNKSLTNNLVEQLTLERNTQIAASKTNDYAEGVQAFLEKRSPLFTGK